MQRINLKFKDRLVLISIFILIIILFSILKLKCPFRYLIGVPCAGCGMTRAIRAMLKHNYSLAFQYHPLFWITPFMLIMGLFGYKVSRKIEIIFWTVVTIMFIIVYLVRVISGTIN